MMQAASFATVVAAIFHHLTRVGYEVVSPMTVHQEEGARMVSSSNSHEVLQLEEEVCPIYLNLLPPEDQEPNYIPEIGYNRTRVDSWCGGIGDVLIWFIIPIMWRQWQRYKSQEATQAEADILAEGPVQTNVLLLDEGVLGGFYERCIRSPAHEKGAVLEFVEGFTDDLLQALRHTLGREADVQVEDFIGVGSVYESWSVSKPLVCDLIVPLALQEPCSFSFQLWNSSVNGVCPVQPAWGRIQLNRATEGSSSCLCGTASLEEDIMCLLHGSHTVTIANILGNHLCLKDTPYLDRDQVIKWFRMAITNAWEQISHKYEFELTFRNLESAGALKIRFRSGRTITFNLTPVIQFEDSDAYFVSEFKLNTNKSSHTHWPLSFAVYEKRLFRYFAKRLQGNSCHIRCLQIVSFLHKKQVRLTGRTTLSIYHLKTALFHLLLDKRPFDWSSNHLENRACDILEFIWKSLQRKELSHALIGNSQVPKEIGIPPRFLTAKPINLFHPLALQKSLHIETMKHFREMLRNAAMLIQEYTPHWPDGNVSQFKSADSDHRCHLRLRQEVI